MQLPCHRANFWNSGHLKVTEILKTNWSLSGFQHQTPFPDVLDIYLFFRTLVMKGRGGNLGQNEPSGTETCLLLNDAKCMSA